MYDIAPEVMIVDRGPIQAFSTLNSGMQFLDHVGNLCIKIDEINGANSVTFCPTAKNTPVTCWIADLAPVRIVKIS
jgi:hypothetical protein